MMLGVVLKFGSESSLCSFSVFEFVHETRRRRNKVSEVRVERIICKGNKYVRAEAWGRRATGIVSVDNGRCIMFQGVKFVHPRGRFCMFVSKDVSNVRALILGNTGTSSACKAISHRVV